MAARGSTSSTWQAHLAVLSVQARSLAAPWRALLTRRSALQFTYAGYHVFTKRALLGGAPGSPPPAAHPQLTLRREQAP